jgi:hypothetical protein
MNKLFLGGLMMLSLDIFGQDDPVKLGGASNNSRSQAESVRQPSQLDIPGTLRRNGNVTNPIEGLQQDAATNEDEENAVIDVIEVQGTSDQPTNISNRNQPMDAHPARVRVDTLEYLPGRKDPAIDKSSEAHD